MGWSVKQCLRIALRNMKGRQLFLVYDGGLAANLLTHCMFLSAYTCTRMLMRFFSRLFIGLWNIYKNGVIAVLSYDVAGI